jgi:hypothetical protein
MKQSLVVVVILVSLVVSIGLAGRTTLEHGRHSPVYSLLTVANGLSRDPAAWLHHTILIRGIAHASPCSLAAAVLLCGSTRYRLSDPDTAAVWLDLIWTGAGPVSTFLRHVPLVRLFVPVSQQIQWDMIAVYRVQLRVDQPCNSTCYQAQLLNVVP